MNSPRIFSSIAVASGSSASAGWAGSQNPRAWGVLVPSGANGTISLEGSGSFPGSAVAGAGPVPCYVTGVTTTAGTIYILS
jgi:hypothetical protein